MRTVKLVGKTLHGKNRISQHGEVWEVIKESELFLYLQSLNNTFSNGGKFEKDIRQVGKKDDPNFEIIE